jgi:hypothetical protein
LHLLQVAVKILKRSTFSATQRQKEVECSGGGGVKRLAAWPLQEQG